MIPFSKATVVGTELSYIKSAMSSGDLSGGGEYTRRCQSWIENLMGGESKVLLTTSCTTALELAAILADIKPGDEIIAPSYTFISTINAFVLRGATAVFVDVQPGTMNIDHSQIEAAITPKTRVIIPVHYGGVACEMDSIMALASKYGLLVIEDAAQSLTSTYKSKALGSIGHMACFSFHDKKNITAGGQGGAIVLNDPSLFSRAEIVHDNGTNRRQFFRGEVNSYEWMDIGSNFFMSELQAAYLWAQLEASETIFAQRHNLWNSYSTALRPLAEAGLFRLSPVAKDCAHNAHMFHVMLYNNAQRETFTKYMKRRGISVSAHYVPLHSRPMGISLGRFVGEDHFTTVESERLIRLPLYYGMTSEELNLVLGSIVEFFAPESSLDEMEVNATKANVTLVAAA